MSSLGKPYYVIHSLSGALFCFCRDEGRVAAKLRAGIAALLRSGRFHLLSFWGLLLRTCAYVGRNGASIRKTKLERSLALCEIAGTHPRLAVKCSRTDSCLPGQTALLSPVRYPCQQEASLCGYRRG